MPDTNTLDYYLALGRRQGASDLHIGATQQPIVRKDGSLFMLEETALTPEDTESLLFGAISDAQAEKAKKELTLELCIERPEGRYRACLIKSRLGWEGCFHIIPSEIPTPEELGLTEACKKMTSHRNGLVLITGPRGSGKTTTLASLIDLLNEEKPDHIITVEDPVEYLIPSKRAIVSQRTVGLHTETFASALRASLREDPDVIAIGELRDLETVSMAVTAAETGHLVLASLHTGSAAASVSRVVESFPPDQQPQIRTMVAESLRGVISQRLVPRKDGNGRVLALEILVNHSGIASLIRESRMFQIRSAVQTGRKHGMQLLDDHLNELVSSGVVEADVAKRLAEAPDKVGR